MAKVVLTIWYGTWNSNLKSYILIFTWVLALYPVDTAVYHCVVPSALYTLMRMPHKYVANEIIKCWLRCISDQSLTFSSLIVLVFSPGIVESQCWKTMINVRIGRNMVGGLFYTLPSIAGLTSWFVLILHSSHKILCESHVAKKSAWFDNRDLLN